MAETGQADVPAEEPKGEVVPYGLVAGSPDNPYPVGSMQNPNVVGNANSQAGLASLRVRLGGPGQGETALDTVPPPDASPPLGVTTPQPRERMPIPHLKSWGDDKEYGYQVDPDFDASSFNAKHGAPDPEATFVAENLSSAANKLKADKDGSTAALKERQKALGLPELPKYEGWAEQMDLRQQQRAYDNSREQFVGISNVHMQPWNRRVPPNFEAADGVKDAEQVKNQAADIVAERLKDTDEKG